MDSCHCQKNYKCLVHCKCHLHFTCLYHRPDYNRGYPGMELNLLIAKEGWDETEIQRILKGKYLLATKNTKSPIN